MKLSTHFFTYNKVSRTFTAKMSDLPKSATYKQKPNFGITLNNPTTNTSKVYTFTKADLTPDHEIIGWRYTNDNTNTHILIIND